MVHFINVLHHLNVFECWKYGLNEWTCRFRENCWWTTENHHHQINQPIAKSASALYYCTSTALYESCNLIARRREAMKFAAAKGLHWIRWPSRQPAAVFHEICENPIFHARRFGQFSDFPCKSHAAFHGPVAAIERIRAAKNVDHKNECAGFEEIDDELPKTTITRSIAKSASACYYSTNTTLYESCNLTARHREAVQFAAAKKRHWIWWPKCQPA